MESPEELVLDAIKKVFKETDIGCSNEELRVAVSNYFNYALKDACAMLNPTCDTYDSGRLVFRCKKHPESDFDGVKVDTWRGSCAFVNRRVTAENHLRRVPDLILGSGRHQTYDAPKQSTITSGPISVNHVKFGKPCNRYKLVCRAQLLSCYEIKFPQLRLNFDEQQKKFVEGTISKFERMAQHWRVEYEPLRTVDDNLRRKRHLQRNCQYLPGQPKKHSAEYYEFRKRFFGNEFEDLVVAMEVIQTMTIKELDIRNYQDLELKYNQLVKGSRNRAQKLPLPKKPNFLVYERLQDGFNVYVFWTV
ncbi:hypothetical protein L596_020160 [Steinernema carpocapsae]|uniref:Uncharacterized protein n=1 Tax=Steinernema carpocapsae TaxID=34508 RepID=A0A4U5MSU0_STECR|nr:hypothetical protein L596_020160 [Steinernema carpocapsae]